MKDEATLFVHADFFGEPEILGSLRCSFSKGRQIYSFEFSEEWLSAYPQINLDPDLYGTRGRQYVPAGKKIFGFLSDCLPDRWGRRLMKRKEEIQAKKENRPPRELTEYDFLVGVNDEARMGALRFKLPGSDKFLSGTDGYSVPPFESIRKLEAASLNLEKTEFFDDESLRVLLEPGSSLGGARPKATVKDADGCLWIAKFPSRHDEFNSGAWEKVASDLAREAGLDVPDTLLKKFSSPGCTFLTRRFDRFYENGAAKRIHCASALTMLGKVDGAGSGDGSSYLELADFIRANGACPKKDLEELWNRIVFSILISNTDDHLRNHDFILGESGWRLAPLFDVNPNPLGRELSLNITEGDNSKKLSLAMETAEYYGIDAGRARRNADRIALAVKENWIRLAKNCGCTSAEIERMKSAFEDKSVSE